MTLVGKDFSGLGGGLGMLGSEDEVGGSEGCHDGAADSDTSRCCCCCSSSSSFSSLSSYVYY